MKNYSFEDLPDILNRIEGRLERIEEILSEKFNQEAPEDDILGAKQASRILKFSVPTLYSKVCRREVPFYKRGNRLYFSKHKLLEWIQNGKKKSLNEISADAMKVVKKMETKDRFTR